MAVAYFQVKFRVGVISSDAERTGTVDGAGAGTAGASTAQIEAANAVSKFAALGTYLANLRDGTTRERYTQLTWELEKIVAQAVRTSRADLDKLFEAADKMFSVMTTTASNRRRILCESARCPTHPSTSSLLAPTLAAT
jgi:hypothetical protein